MPVPESPVFVGNGVVFAAAGHESGMEW